MKIDTSRFGAVEVEENQIIGFHEGLLGFEHLSKYVLLPAEDSHVFTWLQSTEVPQVAFLLTDPFVFFADYAVDLKPEFCDNLEIGSREDVVVQTIVNIPETGVKDMTVNLAGPLVINVKKRAGKQLVLPDSGYTTRHKLFQKGLSPECVRQEGES